MKLSGVVNNLAREQAFFNFIERAKMNLARFHEGMALCCCIIFEYTKIFCTRFSACCDSEIKILSTAVVCSRLQGMAMNG